MGMKSARVSWLNLDNVRVPGDMLLGKPGEGFHILMDELEACVEVCEPGAITIDSKANSFLFKVESTGALSPEEIVEKSAEILKERIRLALDYANSL